MLVVHKQVNSLRIMVTEYKKIAKGKKKKDRRDLCYLCQMRNYYTNQFSFDNSLWLNQELLPHLISTQPSIDPLIKDKKCCAPQNS